MTSSLTSPLVLHAVRLLGFADVRTIADRAGAGLDETRTVLRDADRRGWIQHTSFADLDGWSLTEAGRAENERRLARQRTAADPDGRILAVYGDFLPLNARLLRACTDWQLRPAGDGRLAHNDHSDAGWDARVLAELAALGAELAPLVARLARVLKRFGGYDARFTAALRRAREGHDKWIDGSGVDSCHRVWFQLHEDLLATLGLERGGES